MCFSGTRSGMGRRPGSPFFDIRIVTVPARSIVQGHTTLRPSSSHPYMTSVPRMKVFCWSSVTLAPLMSKRRPSATSPSYTVKSATPWVANGNPVAAYNPGASLSVRTEIPAALQNAPDTKVATDPVSGRGEHTYTAPPFLPKTTIFSHGWSAEHRLSWYTWSKGLSLGLTNPVVVGLASYAYVCSPCSVAITEPSILSTSGRRISKDLVASRSALLGGVTFDVVPPGT